MKSKFTIYIVALMVITNSWAQERKLTLQEALTLAKENNKVLQVEEFESETAHAMVQEARGNMLPSITANGNYAYYFNRQVIFMPGALVGYDTNPVVDVAVGGKNTFNTNIVLNQYLLNGSVRNHIRVAKLQEAKQKLKMGDVASQLVLSVSEKYYSIVLLKASIELHKQSLERNQRSLLDSKMLLLQGKNLKTDTLRNFIAVENVRSIISYLENELAVVSLTLKNDLGIDSSEDILLVDQLHINEDELIEVFTSVPNEAAINRADIQQAKLNVDLIRTIAIQQRSKRIPTVSIVGMYQLQAQSDDRKFDSYRWPRTSFIGLQASFPLFSGGSLNATIRQANLRAKQSEVHLQQTQEDAVTEIGTIKYKYHEAQKQVKIHQATVEAAELSYSIINNRYRSGLSSRLELSDAELALTQAMLLHLQSVYNLKILRLKYDEALGMLEF
jgi:outer membrane protein